MNIKIKRNSLKRAFAMLLAVCMMVSMVPMMQVQAIEVGTGNFNPNTAALEFEFQIQYTQYVAIQVLVDGKHFGWIFEEELLAGYDGAMSSQDPCAPDYGYTLPPNYPNFGSMDFVAFHNIHNLPDEYALDGQEGKGEGYYTLSWTGRINGFPAVDFNANSDSYTVTIIVRPLGFPDAHDPTCVTDDEGNVTHGEDWIWTQQYATPIDVVVDYATILGADWEEFLCLLKQGGLSDKLMLELLLGMTNILNWISMPSLQQEIEKIDPVNMIDGSFVFKYTDLKLEGQYPLAFTRAYNSRGWDGAFGQGFTHSFDYTLVDDNGILHLYLPGGEKLVFLRHIPDAPNDYYTVSNREFELKDVEGGANDGGYIMEYKTGAQFIFNADGELIELRNELGDTVYTLTHSDGNLKKINGVNGYMELSYNSDGHITKVTDSAGRSVSYTYDGDNLTSVTNPDNDTLYYTYDGNGYIATATDFEGVTYVKNTYDAKGRVTKQIFVNANVETTHAISYDDVNLINTHTDSAGWETKYAYDEYRNLLYTEDADGRTASDYMNYVASELVNKDGYKTEYIINDDGNITNMQYANDNEIKVAYNSNNLVKQIDYKDGSSEIFYYDPSETLLTSHKDRNGNITRYTYNNGFLHTVTDALGGVTTYNYDTAGILQSVKNAENEETKYTYDDVSRITSVEDPMGGLTSYKYSNAGKLEEVTQKLDATTSYTTKYEYNANGFTTKTTDALGNYTTTKYGTNGRILSFTDAEENSTTYTYNDNGRVASVSDGEGVVTKYFYDEKGRMSHTEDSGGNKTTYEYDKMDRPISTTDALGSKSKVTYDEMGQIVSVTDALGNATSYKYDFEGRRTEIKDALDAVTKYEYDYNGNLTKITDANGNETTMKYDELNRLIQQTNAEGSSVYMYYDRVGRLLSEKNELGFETFYDYDKNGNLVKMTDAEGNETEYAYDLLGRTTSVTNPDGTSVSYEYDALGRTTAYFNELGFKTSYEYNKNGAQTSITDPMCNETKYTYNGANQVATITAANGAVTRYAYNSLGQTASVTTQQSAGVFLTTSYTYNAVGRTNTVTDAENYVTQYFYDPVGNTTKVTKDGNIVSASVYNEVNRLMESIDGLGNSAFYDYDLVGNLMIYTDREGNKTEYEYNDIYAVTKVINALDGETVTDYDKLGRVTQYTDALGNSANYTYDKNGQTLTATNELGGVISYEYDSRGRIVSLEDALGNTTGYTYDAAGNLTVTTDAAGMPTVYKYDKNGNMTKLTDRVLNYVDYEYDNMNRLVKTTTELHHSTQYEYDLAGNLVTFTDGNKNSTLYTYDGLNRTASETNAVGGMAAYTYNYLGALETYTTYGANEEIATTSYEYDLAENLKTETSPLGYKTTYTYDKMGNVVTSTDENGVLVKYDYDELYRQTTRWDLDDTARYTYDAVGNILTATNDVAGEVSFKYDELYRLKEVTNEDGTKTVNAFDANGQRTHITYPDTLTVSYTYDENGNVTSILDHDGTGIVYDRDYEGRVVAENHSDGSVTRYDYDAAGNLDTQWEVVGVNDNRRTIDYVYDAAGNLRNELRTGIDTSLRDDFLRYYYDKANQLVGVEISGVRSDYSYDKAGNLLNDGENSYTYDLQNRMLTRTTADGKTTYEYDKAGNLIKETAPDGAEVLYTYNAQNRLILGETSEGETSSYVYNALGARVQNEQYRENENFGYKNSNLFDGSGGVDYQRFLDDWRATWQRAWETEVGTTVQNNFETVTKNYVVDYLSLANRDIFVTEEGSFTQRYVYDLGGTRLSAEFDYAEGTARGATNSDGEYGENFQSDFAANEVSKVWYRTSLLGSTLFAVDADGEIIAHTIYDPWGAPVTETYTDSNFSGIENLTNFTGYTFDEVLGLYFAQNRFYDAETHRFTQEDPIKDGSNWYVYCGNEPQLRVDWLGLAVTLIAGASITVGNQTINEVYQNDNGKLYVRLYSGVRAYGATITMTDNITGDFAMYKIEKDTNNFLNMWVYPDGGATVHFFPSSVGQSDTTKLLWREGWLIGLTELAGFMSSIGLGKTYTYNAYQENPSNITNATNALDNTMVETKDNFEQIKCPETGAYSTMSYSVFYDFVQKVYNSDKGFKENGYENGNEETIFKQIKDFCNANGYPYVTYQLHKEVTTGDVVAESFYIGMITGVAGGGATSSVANVGISLLAGAALGAGAGAVSSVTIATQPGTYITHGIVIEGFDDIRGGGIYHRFYAEYTVYDATNSGNFEPYPRGVRFSVDSSTYSIFR